MKGGIWLARVIFMQTSDVRSVRHESQMAYVRSMWMGLFVITLALLIGWEKMFNLEWLNDCLMTPQHKHKSAIGYQTNVNLEWPFIQNILIQIFAKINFVVSILSLVQVFQLELFRFGSQSVLVIVYYLKFSMDWCI